MKLSEELNARGFVKQFSASSLGIIVDDKKRTVYHGIDPTADSAHAGNFVVWMLLKHLVNHGHRVIFLVGGGTGMIGDPKPDVERTLSDPQEILERVKKLEIQAKHLLGDSVRFVNNYDWLQSVSLISFLRDIGKHFTVNELIKKEAIETRLSSEVGLSYTEFAYPLLQAYDYLELHTSQGCDVQVGGSDQWGNIVAGVDLIRRVAGAEVFALTVPLITDKTTGKKFGKSEGNAVWLDAEKTSPYIFYQFWFNTADENVIDYLKLFTMLSLEKIAELEQMLFTNPGERTVQKILATEVTTLVHGTEVCTQVAQVSACLFGEKSIVDLSESEKTLLKEVAPNTTLQSGVSLVEAVVSAGLATSKREARTFVESGAVSVSGEKVTDKELVLEKSVYGELIHLKRGKRNIALVVLS